MLVDTRFSGEENQNLARKIVANISDSKVCFETLATDGNTHKTLGLEFKEKAKTLAAALREYGLEPGNRVAILSNTREEWALAELASYLAGASIVTLYPSDAPERVGFVLNDSKVKLLFAENQEMLDKVIAAREMPATIPAGEDHQERIATLEKLKKAITFEKTTVTERYSQHVTDLEHIFSEKIYDESRPVRAGSNEEASIIYTSGTTGLPKGVVATHEQHAHNVEQVRNAEFIRENTRVFHILPQAHGFGMRMVHCAMNSGGVSVFPPVLNTQSSTLGPEEKEQLVSSFKDARAEIYPVVPKILSRMKAGIEAAAAAPGLTAKLLGAVLEAYPAYAKAQREGKSLGFTTRMKFEALRLSGLGRLIKNKVKKQLVGPNFRYFISGGAKLPVDTHDFFAGMGLAILEGYGSTETNVPVSVNTGKYSRAGTVGRLLDESIEAKISDEGELLIRGPQLAKGYLDRPSATARTWDKDGWYHTKDMAEIDKDGYLKIFGRFDDVLVTTTGENIQALNVEGRISSMVPAVSDLVVVGDARPCLTALIIVNREQLPSPLRKAELQSEELRAYVRTQLEEHYHQNDETRSFEKLRDFVLIPEPEIGKGYTATMKLQRKKLIQIYQEELEQLYEGLKK